MTQWYLLSILNLFNIIIFHTSFRFEIYMFTLLSVFWIVQYKQIHIPKHTQCRSWVLNKTHWILSNHIPLATLLGMSRPPTKESPTEMVNLFLEGPKANQPSKWWSCLGDSKIQGLFKTHHIDLLHPSDAIEDLHFDCHPDKGAKICFIYFHFTQENIEKYVWKKLTLVYHLGFV